MSQNIPITLVKKYAQVSFESYAHYMKILNGFLFLQSTGYLLINVILVASQPLSHFYCDWKLKSSISNETKSSLFRLIFAVVSWYILYQTEDIFLFLLGRFIRQALGSLIKSSCTFSLLMENEIFIQRFPVPNNSYMIYCSFYKLMDFICI
jgi:hypothetical protein